MKRKRHSFKKIEYKKKEPLEPLFKKQGLITALSVFLVVLITMTGSFAIFTKTSEGNEYNVVQVGELELSYVDLNDEGNVLGLADNYPISDTDGEASTPYRFSVENTGTIIADYTVKIIQDTDTIDADGCSDNLIDDSYLRYKFDNETSGNLKDKLDATTNEYIIYSGTLEPNESNIHEIRLWINENSPNSILGTHYHGKVVIEVTQNNATDPYERPVAKSIVFDTAASNLGENCKTYDDGTDTFLVGQCSNNYVWYSGKLWRVVLKNNETGAIKMITDNAITAIPYNAEGVTIYENSYTDQWLNQEFLPTLHDYENYLIVDSIWDVTENPSNTPSRPQYSTSVTRTVGLLNFYEYYTIYESSDGLATYSSNYLVNRAEGNLDGISWLLMTPYDSSDMRWVRNPGDVNHYPSTGGFSVRPSINLKPEIKVMNGTGSMTNPYILESDLRSYVNGTTLLSTRYSGEYITFNNELYRIVNIENGLTKITPVDEPNGVESIPFHSKSGVNFASASIKTYLETYYQSIKTTNEIAYNMIEPNTTWYLGTVGDGMNYKASICANVNTSLSMNSCVSKTVSTTANIALPRVGEMFASQITRGPRINIWLINPFSSSNPSHASSSGDYNLFMASNSFTLNVRPSMYLKSTIKIASNNTGNGTYEKPYSIEQNIEELITFTAVDKMMGTSVGEFKVPKGLTWGEFINSEYNVSNDYGYSFSLDSEGNVISQQLHSMGYVFTSYDAMSGTFVYAKSSDTIIENHNYIIYDPINSGPPEFEEPE